MNNDLNYLEINEKEPSVAIETPNNNLKVLKMARNLICLFISIYFISYSIIFAWAVADEYLATKTPSGTVQLLFERVENGQYDGVNNLYNENMNMEKIKELNKQGIYLQKISSVVQNDEYAVVEFHAKLIAENNDIIGQFALKKVNNKWLIIPEPTDEDLRKIQEI